ncbi:MAG: nucleotide exchange factor GrpE [Desulfamplus sp.]|nr:nucleotide exchange factor GrpE [Desulfamplus sp.]
MKQNESQEILTDNEIPQESPNPQEVNVNTGQCDSEQSQSSAENKPPDNTSSEPTVEQLQSALAAEKDRVLRLSAEFDNYKKRSAREMADFRKFANESVFKQFLTVIDNLERALSSVSVLPATTEDSVSQNSSDAQKNSIIHGVELTCKDIIKLFEAFSVKPVEAQGKPFDPVYHQAVSHQESSEYPENTVITELQKGYILHDRLLRPSMVIVSKSVSKQEAVEQQG